MKTSKGEQKVIDLLRKSPFSFEREKTFSDLRGGRYRFDFYIESQNILIEVDGEQHFHQISHFQKQRRDFLQSQGNDRKKNSYAIANKIKLYRIPFWEIDNLKNYKDIFQNKFLVKSMWHNDKIWREFQKH